MAAWLLEWKRTDGSTTVYFGPREAENFPEGMAGKSCHQGLCEPQFGYHLDVLVSLTFSGIPL